VLRPPIAQERLTRTADGRVLPTLKAEWSDGTTHLLFEPIELLERPAALTPRPRINLVLHHGVLASHSRWRARAVTYGRDTPAPVGHEAALACGTTASPVPPSALASSSPAPGPAQVSPLAADDPPYRAREACTSPCTFTTFAIGPTMVHSLTRTREVWTMTGPTLEAAAVLSSLFMLALLGAYIVFKFLKTTARIERKGIQLGGAGAMFVVMFILLNHYLPDIREGLVEEAHAAAQPIARPTAQGTEEIAKVVLSPATQVVPSSDLRRLDRNLYDIDESLGVAIPRPSSSRWEQGPFNELQVVGVGDIPFFGTSMQAFQGFMSMRPPVIRGVRSGVEQTVTLDGESKIGTIPMTLNPFEDVEVVRASVKASAGMMKQLGLPKMDPAEIPEEKLRQMQSVMQEMFAARIAESLPVTKVIHNGVFVMLYDRSAFEGSTVAKLAGGSLLDDVIGALSMSGVFAPGALRNYYVDQQRGIASFNASVELRNAEINQRRTDAIVNTVGFIVTGESRAMLVLLVYLSTTPVEEFQQLQVYLDAIRFVG